MTAKHNLLYGLLLMLLCLHETTQALQCLRCDHAAEARDCQNLVTCGSHETCFVQRFIATNLRQYYKLGCTDRNVCHRQQFALGKRDASSIYSHSAQSRAIQSRDKQARESNIDMVLCLQCCNSTNGCNKDLCGSPPTNSLRCLSCLDVMEPKDCDHLKECSRSELCYVHKGPLRSNFEIRHDMGCMGQAQCRAFKTIYPKSCATCCNQTDLCNYAACDGWPHVTPTPGTSTPGSTTVPAIITPTTPPHVIINGPDRDHYQTQTQLTCITVPPAQTNTWTFNGNTTLPSGVSIQQTPTSAGSVAGIDTLTIANLTDTTLGQYTCIAIVNGHIIEKTHPIGIIPEKPTATIQKPPVSKNFALQCKITGYPVPLLEWDFVPARIGSHGIPPGVQFSDLGAYSTLFVKDYQPREHDGTWYCKASNSEGNTITQVQIP